jgi:diguanylate cyclase (GGDEF)-like protein/PAS domain S-box-containing protein
MQSHLNHIDADGGAVADFHADALVLAGMGVWACDLRTDTISWTPAVFDIFGLPRNERVERRDTVDMYVEPFRVMLERVRSAAIASQGTFSLEAAIVRPSGEERWIRVKAATRVHDGRAATLYGVKQDITDERQRWDRLRRSSEHDALTGFAHRARFHARFLDQAAGSEALSTLGALALFDLDNLREINRRWGIAAGDACLAALARRLSTAFPAGTWPGTWGARLGGGEFAMLADREGAARLYGAGQSLSSLVDPIPWLDSVIPIHVSAGIVFLEPYRIFEAEALYAQATLALEAAKRKHRTPLRVAAATLDADGWRATAEAPSVQNPSQGATFQLSPREAEVLRHIARGCTTDEMARAMAVSRHTVRNFIRRIYQKMDVGGRVDAVRLAVQHGLL